MLMHTITSEDLLQYLYRETSSEKTTLIKATLENDWNLQEEFKLLSAEKDMLETISLSPSKKSIDNILNYAKKKVEPIVELV